MWLTDDGKNALAIILVFVLFLSLAIEYVLEHMRYKTGAHFFKKKSECAGRTPRR